MDKTDLISYLSELKELETLLFLNKHFKSLYLTDCNEKEPEKPFIQTKYNSNDIFTQKHPYGLSAPEKPESGSIIGGLIVIVIAILLFRLGIYCWNANKILLGFFVGGPSFVIAIYAAAFGIGIIRNKLIYSEKMDNYNFELKSYEEKIKKLDIENENKLYIYEKNMKLFSEEKNKMLERVDSLSFEIEKKLNTMYQEEIVYPKYRNFVSICAFCEYLECGRCESLDGQNGAYNLYEQELRQNIIISQLSQIMNDIEEIKNSQYCLYQQLKQSTEYAEKLLENIKDEIALNNYFMESVAKVHGTFLYK